ncbi:MAG: hypothetical protein JWO62_85 [Acidimicrobiaceae bacterium]|nr:hypothetical protein [Acidimicrobiaceae bacterium]
MSHALKPLFGGHNRLRCHDSRIPSWSRSRVEALGPVVRQLVFDPPGLNAFEEDPFAGSNRRNGRYEHYELDFLTSRRFISGVAGVPSYSAPISLQI